MEGGSSSRLSLSIFPIRLMGSQRATFGVSQPHLMDHRYHRYHSHTLSYTCLDENGGQMDLPPHPFQSKPVTDGPPDGPAIRTVPAGWTTCQPSSFVHRKTATRIIRCSETMWNPNCLVVTMFIVYRMFIEYYRILHTHHYLMIYTHFNSSITLWSVLNKNITIIIDNSSFIT